MKSLNEWCKAIHEYAREKGWWDKPKTDLECHMLMVSEIAEGSEEVRDGRPPIYYWVEIDNHTKEIHPCDGKGHGGYTQAGKLLKPEGEAIELADCVIRIMDYFEWKGWDLEHAVKVKHNYNLTRPKMHGGKKL